MTPYQFKILDGDDVAYDLPRKIVLPTEQAKYAKAKWQANYSLYKLSYLIYGSTEFVWLLLACNKLTNPYQKIEEFSFLLPDFLNEVVIE